MRIKITVMYGDEDSSLVGETEEYNLFSANEDPAGFEEAQEYLLEALVDPYSDEGHELEEDPEESSVGVDYLQAYVLYEPFDSEQEAKDFLEQFLADAAQALVELE